MYSAAANGICEIRLGPRYRIYHIEHASGWTPQNNDQLFARLDAQGIRYLSKEDLAMWRARVAADPQSGLVNDPDWGLAQHKLTEREI
jgi:hypothetical protein